MGTLFLTLLLATFDGGVVTVADLVREETFLSRDERTFREVQGFSAEASRQDWIERIALRQIGRRLAEAQGFTADGAKVELARSVARDFLLGRWASNCYGFGFELPADEALAEEIAPTLPPLPPRLKLTHLFRRATTPEQVAAAVAELERLAEEVHSLDEFRRLARERSDSGSAAKAGELGWVRKGWLQGQAEALLDQWPVGKLTAPMPLKGGVHLFWIEDRKPEEPQPLHLFVKKRRRELTEAALADCRRRRLAQAPNLEREPQPSESERLFRLALTLGVPSADETARMADLEDNVWLDQVVAARVDERLGTPTEEELEARFRAGTYLHPRQLAVTRLTAPLPKGSDPLLFFEALRLAVERGADGGAWTAVVAAAGPGAWLDELPLTPAIDVAAFLEPAVFDRITRLAKGAVAGPFQTESGLVVVKMDDERPDAPLSFAEARERLFAEWTRERRRRLRGVVAGELLALSHFRRTNP